MVTFNWYFRINSNQGWLREFTAEFLGTFLLIFVGNNAVAQSVLSEGQAGNFVTIYIGYALGLMMGILVSAGISGAHLNPAVTVANAFAKRFDWYKIPHYLVAQYLGGFIAASATYLLYIDNFDAYHNNNGVTWTTAGIFATYPTKNLSVTGCFIDQILGTMVLVIAIYAITDEKNAKVPSYLASIYIPLVLLAIGCCMGMNQGYALNPARDLSPRFFTFLTCWGSGVFASDTYWYVPIIGPHAGAILGCSLYVLCIEKMRSNNEDNDEFSMIAIEKSSEVPAESVSARKRSQIS